MATSSIPSISSTRTSTRSPRAVGRFFPHVVGPDRQLAVAAIRQHGELHTARAAVVEQGVDRGAHGAAGVEHVVDQHDGRAATGKSMCVEWTTGW